MLKCMKCSKDFYSAALYLGHIRAFHYHEASFIYLCSFNGCPSVFKTYSAFRTHLLKHELQPKGKPVKLHCMSCGYYSYLKTRFISHYRRHNVINCPIKNCHQSYNIFSSFSSHLCRRHPQYSVADFKYNFLSTESLFHEQHEIQDNCAVDDRSQLDAEIQCSNDLREYQNNVSMFILKMQEKFLLPETTINEVISGMYELQNENIRYVKHNILQSLKEKNIQEDAVVQSILDSSVFNNELMKAFSNMQSKHLKRKFMDSVGLVSPTQYKIGFCRSFQYVSVIKNLQAFCRNTNILNYIVTPPTASKNGMICDIHDGTVFWRNEIFQSFPNIQILLYFDEFGVTNPLRGNQYMHKVAAVYYTLGNLPSVFRSKIQDMQLALLCKACDLKTDGFSVILTPLLKELKILETEGIFIDGISEKVRGSLACIIADNLGAHQLGGFTTCFSNTVLRTCRFCLAKSNEMQKSFNERSFLPRTKELHNHHLNMIKTDPSYTSVYGVKFSSPFSELKYFDVCYMFPPDAMHDLLKGIVPMELGLIIDKFIKSKYITLPNE